MQTYNGGAKLPPNGSFGGVFINVSLGQFWHSNIKYARVRHTCAIFVPFC
jgi:hypothetical protein